MSIQESPIGEELGNWVSSPAEPLRLEPGLGFDLDQLDGLKPYTSFLAVHYPKGPVEGLVESILETLALVVDEILIERLVAAVGELLEKSDGRPPWFEPLAEMLGLEDPAHLETQDVLSALGARLRDTPSRPTVLRSTGESVTTGPDLATRVCDLIALDAASYRRRTLMTLRSPHDNEPELEVGALGYLELRRPGWWASSSRGPIDRLHQIVLVCRRRIAGQRGRYLAFYASESAAKQRIARVLSAADPPPPFQNLVRIDRQVLDAAFVERDRPTAWKADGKILIGPDLENALEPLGDQTYYFTAARCLVPVDGQRMTVGVAPRRSSLWAGPVSSWQDFRRRVALLLDHIALSPRGEESPLSVLAAEVRVQDAEEIAGAYDMSVISPELLSEEPNLDSDLRDQSERWAYDAHFFDFRPKAELGPSFVVQVAVEGAYVGALEIELGRSSPCWSDTSHPMALGRR